MRSMAVKVFTVFAFLACGVLGMAAAAQASQLATTTVCCYGIVPPCLGWTTTTTTTIKAGSATFNHPVQQFSRWGDPTVTIAKDSLGTPLNIRGTAVTISASAVPSDTAAASVAHPSTGQPGTNSGYLWKAYKTNSVPFSGPDSAITYVVIYKWAPNVPGETHDRPSSGGAAYFSSNQAGVAPAISIVGQLTPLLPMADPRVLVALAMVLAFMAVVITRKRGNGISTKV